MHVWQRRSCRHPAPGQDLIPLQRLHVFAHSRDPHPAIKLWCQVPFTKSKIIFQIEIIVSSASWKANIIKVELSMIKICELLRKLLSLRSCFLILPPGAFAPQGIEGLMKRDLSKHWVYPPVMCQQRSSYCTWELNVMEDFWISNKISLKYVPWGLIDNKTSLVEIMGCHWLGDKPLSEPMMA